MRNKNSFFLIYSVLPMFFLTTDIWAGDVQFCTPNLPGVESAKLDQEGEVVLKRVDLGPSGQQGFIATEYLGSANLQTSIYTQTKSGYCLVGDLGGVTSVEVHPHKSRSRLYPLAAHSVSGPFKFTRNYRYQNGAYAMVDCFVKEDGQPRRRCNPSEE